MKQKKSIFLFISSLVHFFMLFIFSKYSPSSSQNISVQIDENVEIAQSSKQIVEQQVFNKKIPKETRYFSQHNHTTSKEYKGKLGQSPSQNLQPTSPASDESTSADIISRASSFYGRIDHLEQIPATGEQTILNTKEIWFYTFNSRVKHQIYWHWIREIQSELQNLEKSTIDSLINQGAITTHIEALLNSKGHLNSLIIRKKSGLEELDRASVNSIYKAHPFPNPPTKLISKNGLVRLNYTFNLSNDF